MYWGSDNTPEPNILRAGSILFYDPENEEQLLNQVATLNASSTAYREFIQQDRFLPSAAEYIYKYIEDVEQAILDRL